MAYDEALAARLHDLLDGEPGVTSRRMFGGIGFMVDGSIAVAAASSGALMVRVDRDDGAAWIDGDVVNPMEMGGRTMAGWLLVASTALADDAALSTWVGRGVAFARTLPPKPSP